MTPQILSYAILSSILSRLGNISYTLSPYHYLFGNISNTRKIWYSPNTSNLYSYPSFQVLEVLDRILEFLGIGLEPEVMPVLGSQG